MKRVHGIVDPEIDKNYPKMRQVRVEIVTKAGKTYPQKLDWFRGEGECPLSEHEIEAKLMNLASGALGSNKARRLSPSWQGWRRQRASRRYFRW
jgi:2-methylcitrate dehydratase PrpD